MAVIYESLWVLKEYGSKEISKDLAEKANTTDNPNNSDLDFSGVYNQPNTTSNTGYKIQY